MESPEVVTTLTCRAEDGTTIYVRLDGGFFFQTMPTGRIMIHIDLPTGTIEAEVEQVGNFRAGQLD